MKYLPNILKFVELTHKFQQVKRRILVPGRNYEENDAEHSYQLAMVGWYMAASENLKLDLNKVVKYALIHDLVEVYAGDTSVFTDDKDFIESKEYREEQALAQLIGELPEFAELQQLLKSYHVKADQESKFIYALDKLLSIINNYLDGGRSWKHYKITLDKMVQEKAPKMTADPEVQKYFNELLEILKEKQKELFPEQPLFE